MIVYIVTVWNPEGEERFLTHDGTLTACDACAMRFTDPVTAETAATRALRSGWAFEIEEMEI
jgi:hypothetical protein